MSCTGMGGESPSQEVFKEHLYVVLMELASWATLVMDVWLDWTILKVFPSLLLYDSMIVNQIVKIPQQLKSLLCYSSSLGSSNMSKVLFLMGGQTYKKNKSPSYLTCFFMKADVILSKSIGFYPSLHQLQT